MADFAICNLASIPLRKHPDLLSEMTSQVLFGEHYEILEERGSFQHIRIAHDFYEGWITTRQGEPISEDFYQSLTDKPAPILHDLTATVDLGGNTLQLVRGSRLPQEINQRSLRHEANTIDASQQTLCPKKLEQIASEYLHAPYHWGGRSPFGIDCSGFTQMVFRFFDIQLPRDSQQQGRIGEPVLRFEDARPGDLAFFFEKTSHVGIVSSNGILHASSSVREDILDHDGIRDRQTGELTHELTCIRRCFTPDGQH